MVPSPSPPAPYHLSAEGRWIRTLGTPQRNNFSRPPPFDPPQFAFRKRNRLLPTRNRWFESTSLQRRVICEPDFLGSSPGAARRRAPVQLPRSSRSPSPAFLPRA